MTENRQSSMFLTASSTDLSSSSSSSVQEVQYRQHFGGLNNKENSDLDSNDPEVLNKILESNFELGDACRLASNQQPGRISSNLSDRDLEIGSCSSKLDKFDDHTHEIIVAEDDDNDDLTLNKVFTNKETGELDIPLDRGYAWVVVLAVWLTMFCTWGCNSAFGVFLSFYFKKGTFPGATKYDYAIIAGLPVAVSQLSSPFSMIFMRIIGIKQTMFFGCVLMFVGFMWASYAKHLVELYITQGLLTGISMSFISTPPMTCLPGWFLKKRAVAVGISLLGTGIGGVAFGMACNKLIEDYNGTGWCYRMLAITCTVGSLIAVILVRERVPAEPVGIRSRKLMVAEFFKVFNFKIITKPQVLLITVWFNLAFFAYSLMLYTLSSYAVARGMTQKQGSILTTLLNVGQTIGRPSMGLVGDRYGRRNVTCVLTLVLCILMLAFWIPATTYVQLIFFSLMVGSTVGVANVMNTVMIADTVKPEEFLGAWSFAMYAGTGPILCCEVIAQALTQPNKQNPYLHTQIFVGCCFFCAFLLSLVLREVGIKRNIKRQQLELLSTLNSQDKTENVQIKQKYEKNRILLSRSTKAYFKRVFEPWKI